MLYLYRFAIGYLRVVFYGELNEKILDLTAKNKITLWNIKLTKTGIECYLTVSDFRKLRGIIKKSGVKAHIIEKFGMPFKINKNRKRFG